MEANRNFANKLWNSARFILGNLDGLAPDERQVLCLRVGVGVGVVVRVRKREREKW